MLTHLHVKNLALIREAEIDFTEGLNILTGETGAGKSIVIGSVSLALGGRVAKDMVRPGADYGLAELVFLVNRKKQREKLLELGITPEDDTVIISRKILEGRSINKINGETVTLSQLKEAAALLIDIHGQHEHQSLLQKKKHLEILDEFAKEELEPVKGTPRVFVLAGNGTGTGIFRRLQRAGIPFAAGILWENDLDYPAAKALAAEVISVKPFCPIGDEAVTEAKRLINQCDTVFCTLDMAEVGELAENLRVIQSYARSHTSAYYTKIHTDFLDRSIDKSKI